MLYPVELRARRIDCSRCGIERQVRTGRRSAGRGRGPRTPGRRGRSSLLYTSTSSDRRPAAVPRQQLRQLRPPARTRPPRPSPGRASGAACSRAPPCGSSPRSSSFSSSSAVQPPERLGAVGDAGPEHLRPPRSSGTPPLPTPAAGTAVRAAAAAFTARQTGEQVAVVHFAEEQQRDVHVLRVRPTSRRPRSRASCCWSATACVRIVVADVDADERADAGHVARARIRTGVNRSAWLASKRSCPELLRPVVQPGADLGDDLHRQEVRRPGRLRRRRRRA